MQVLHSFTMSLCRKDLRQQGLVVKDQRNLRCNKVKPQILLLSLMSLKPEMLKQMLLKQMSLMSVKPQMLLSLKALVEGMYKSGFGLDILISF